MDILFTILAFVSIGGCCYGIGFLHGSDRSISSLKLALNAISQHNKRVNSLEAAIKKHNKAYDDRLKFYNKAV